MKNIKSIIKEGGTISISILFVFLFFYIGKPRTNPLPEVGDIVVKNNRAIPITQITDTHYCLKDGTEISLDSIRYYIWE